MINMPVLTRMIETMRAAAKAMDCIDQEAFTRYLNRDRTDVFDRAIRMSMIYVMPAAPMIHILGNTLRTETNERSVSICDVMRACDACESGDQWAISMFADVHTAAEAEIVRFVNEAKYRDYDPTEVWNGGKKA